MDTDPKTDLTALLRAWADGDISALNELLPEVYQELIRIANARLRSRKRGETLNAIALVHEAYLRLASSAPALWQNRAHFFAVASTMMRAILVDRARARAAVKRGRGAVPVTLSEVANDAGFSSAPDLLHLDAVLTEFENVYPRRAKIVEMRFFGGLSEKETADALSLSVATVKRDWTFARAWIRRRLAAA